MQLAAVFLMFFGLFGSLLMCNAVIHLNITAGLSCCRLIQMQECVSLKEFKLCSIGNTAPFYRSL